MSDAPQPPISITNEAPNYGPQGIFNAPITIVQPIDLHQQITTWRAAHRALVRDHSGFIDARLAGFVGRVDEIAAIRQCVATLLPSGGSVLVTGLAGEGKSALMARLVREEHAHALPHHFIPINAGAQYQVTLLRDLIAQLVLKHDLNTFSALSESPTLLSDMFVRVLSHLSAQGHEEVIVIDGLDQLVDAEDGDGVLGFLPTPSLPGIVFVLSTRPDHKLYTLDAHEPHEHYEVPAFSHADFVQLLAHYNVSLSPAQVDRCYATMEHNALYLHRLARELAASPTLAPEVIVARVSDDPGAIFSLAIGPEGRLTHWRDWERAGLPLLRMLLVAAQPLSEHALQALLGVPLVTVRRAVHRLGGLVLRDSSGHCSLYHGMLHSYLQREIFAPSELAAAHASLAAWCADGPGGLASIWTDMELAPENQERVVYARSFYTTHLAHASQWERLWATVDNPAYRDAQQWRDPSGSAYARDLDLARQATIRAAGTLDQGIRLLPKLWWYSWARCRIAGRADQFPDSALEALALLEGSQEAGGLAALLTDTARRAQVLRRIGARLAQRAGNELTGTQLLLQASDAAMCITDGSKRAEVLSAIAADLACTDRLEDALRVAHVIEEDWPRGGALRQIAEICAQRGAWDKANDIQCAIEDVQQRIRCLCALGTRWIELGDTQRATALITEAHTLAGTLAPPAVRAQSLAATGSALQRLGQTSEALQAMQAAYEAANAIDRPSSRAFTLHELALAWDSMGQNTRACNMLDAALALLDQEEQRSALVFPLDLILGAYTRFGAVERAAARAQQVVDDRGRAFALRAVALACAHQGNWEQAAALARTIGDAYLRANALLMIVEWLAEHVQLEQAETVAYHIEDVRLQAEAVGAVAVAAALAGQIVRARALVQDAVALAASERRAWQREDALATASDALGQAGCWEQALAVAQAIQTPRRRAAVTARIVTPLIEMKRWEPAAAALQVIGDAQLLAQAVDRFAAALIRAGHLDQALDLARATPRLFPIADARPPVVVALAEAGHWDQAVAIARLALLPSLRASALLAVADVLLDRDEQEQAHAILTEAEQNAYAISKPRERAEVMRLLAAAVLRAGRPNQTGALLGEAADAARAIEEPRARAEVLAQNASSWALLDGLDAASELLADAITAAEAVEDRTQRLSTLYAVVQVYIRIGAVNHAVDLVRASGDDWLIAETLQIMAASGHAERAIALATSIQHVYWRAYAFRGIGIALVPQAATAAGADILNRVLLSLVELQNPWARDEMLTALAEALLPQHVARSRDIAQRIEDSWRRAKLLATVIIDAVRTHSTVLDQALVDDAAAAASATAAGWQYVDAACAIADAVFQAGQMHLARQCVDHAVAGVDAIPERDQRVRALRDIGRVLVLQRDFIPAGSGVPAAVCDATDRPDDWRFASTPGLRAPSRHRTFAAG